MQILNLTDVYYTLIVFINFYFLFAALFEDEEIE